MPVTSPPRLPASSRACAVTHPGCGAGGMVDVRLEVEDEVDAAADEAAERRK